MSGVRASRLVDEGVQLADGRVLCGEVLVATDTALQELLPELPVRARKGQLVITDRHRPLLHHQVIEMGYAAAAHGCEAASVSFNVQPRPNEQLLIGSSREYDAVDTGVSPLLLQRMLQRAFAFAPALQGLRALRSWCGFRSATVDGLPYLCPVPERKGVWVADRHEGLEITAAPSSARFVFDAILGRSTALSLTPYLPARAWQQGR